MLNIRVATKLDNSPGVKPRICCYAICKLIQFPPRGSAICPPPIKSNGICTHGYQLYSHPIDAKIGFLIVPSNKTMRFEFGFKKNQAWKIANKTSKKNALGYTWAGAGAETCAGTHAATHTGAQNPWMKAKDGFFF